MLIFIIISFFITIVAHELAHAIVALLCGVKVEKIALGFGKKLYQKKIKGIIYQINILPFGGYCKLHGENSKVKEGWLGLPYSKKMIIALAGVTANLLIAFLCYWINFKSIRFGLHVDFSLIRAVFTKDYYSAFKLLELLKPNMLILQIGIMNLFAAITNILPFPALDGGFSWLFPLERFFKKDFPRILDKIIKIGFVVLMALQIILIYWIWFT